MVGLGETREELLQVFSDLAANQVDILTVGQYLRPTLAHLPVVLLGAGGIRRPEGAGACHGLPACRIGAARAQLLPRGGPGSAVGRRNRPVEPDLVLPVETISYAEKP